jgi:hypothetical protein
LIRRFNQRVSGEAAAIAPHGLIESLGRNSIEPRPICIQHYALPTNNENATSEFGQ